MNKHISLKPKDVGFDPRAIGQAVVLPYGTTSVSYVDADGTNVTVVGTADAVVRSLRAAGFTVNVAEPDFEHKDLDGHWNRLLADGTLECRDPNEGQGLGADGVSRHQYRMAGRVLWCRRLPSEKSGRDEWRDADIPGIPEPWRTHDSQYRIDWPLLRDYMEWASCKQLDSPLPMVLSGWARKNLIVLVEHTPNGRDIRAVKDKDGVRFEVQPNNDNYWIKCATLGEARKACHGRV